MRLRLSFPQLYDQDHSELLDPVTIDFAERTSWFYRNKRLRSLIPFYAERTCLLNTLNNESKGIPLLHFIDSELLSYTRYKVGH